MSASICFWLNDQEVVADDPPGLLVLDYLRKHKRLVGTKEGCKEGDCGACTVLVGELNNNNIFYKPVTSCLLPLGELQGKHLVTIEGIDREHLNPVQQAIVDESGTQCGFCTPGIVVSMIGCLMHVNDMINDEFIKEALSGHLCRCTGYRSLKAVTPHLQTMKQKNGGIEGLVKSGFIPRYFLQMPERLSKISQPTPTLGKKTPKHFIAGGTDLYVQRGEELPESRVHLLNLHPQMKGIRRKNRALHIGALTSFEDFANHPEIQKLIPDIKDYMFLIASLQLRHRATIGGNIINASPIGDLTVLFLALEARLVLKNGSKERTVPITEFYLGYKQLDKKSNEILTEVIIPELAPGSKINWEKVSKRKCLDIASVNSAICIQTDANGIIRHVGLAMGGVAPIPLFMKESSAFLTEKPVSMEILNEAIKIAQQEISPISDVRGSVAYKRMLTRQLMIAHFSKLFPEKMKVREFYEEY